MARRIIIELDNENENMSAEEIADVLNEVGNAVKADYTHGEVGTIPWYIQDTGMKFLGMLRE